MGNRIEYPRFGRSRHSETGNPGRDKRKCRCLNRMDGLFFALLLLKLWGVISWSWWLVAAPVWVPVVFAAIGFIGRVGYEMAKQDRGPSA